jgi:hypothetical protein
MAERLAMECRLWVSCVDPWKAAASSPRALPDLLQVLLELGETQREVDRGWAARCEFVKAAA